MSLLRKKKIIATHNGTFHADDLFACAVLTLYFQKKKQPIRIIRTRNPQKIDDAYIALDVGGSYDPEKNRFDHHQKEGAGERENGIPYASFGLIWKHFGMELCDGDTDVWKMIENKIAIPLDAIDNGLDIIVPKYKNILPYSGEQTFLIYQPTWKEKDGENDKIFCKQVKKVAEVMKREIKISQDDIEGQRLIRASYEKAEDKRVVELSQSFPRYLFQMTLSGLPEPLYVVYPGSDGSNWKVEAISKSPETFESRKLFPESWRGYFDGDPKLREITGVPDALFCHRSGFLITAGSHEGAHVLAQKALQS